MATEYIAATPAPAAPADYGSEPSSMTRAVRIAQPQPIADIPWPEWVESNAWQEGTDAIPMLPALAHEIAEIALDPDVPAIRITGVVSKDPVLATSVIQLANSAFSAPAIEITSIAEAVV